MIEVFDLSKDAPSVVMSFGYDVPAEWAVRYAKAEKDGRLSYLFNMQDDGDKISSRFPVTRGRRSVSCGDFAAFYEGSGDD